MSVQAVWNGALVASAEHTVVVDGNHYFLRDSLRMEHFSPSRRTRSLCPWKGLATYYSITVDGQTFPDAAWEYRKPLPFGRKIKDRVAFGPGVEIVTDPRDENQTNRTSDQRP